MFNLQSSIYRYSLIGLILADLVIPALGALYFNWDVESLLFFYWAESLVIGFFTICKMVCARIVPVNAPKLFMIPFFIVHFGGFMAVHAVALTALIHTSVPNSVEGVMTIIDTILPITKTALVVYMCSHGISFFTNFIGKFEYKRASVDQLFMQPYSRVAAMHLAVLFGAVIAMMASVSFSLGLFIVLSALKTFFSVQAHLKERRKYA